MPINPTAHPARLEPVATLLVLLAITAAGLWVRADNLGLRSFSADEVLHVFAARSLAAGGPPVLPSGEPYTRALPVTRLVAAAFARWGESEATARLPSVVAGTLAVPAIYLVGASLFGRVAGLLAAFLLAFSPDAVALSRFVRMYAPMQLLVLLAAWALYLGLAGRGRGRPLGGGGRAAALLAGGGLLLVAARLHAEVYLLLPPVALYLAAMTAARAAVGGWRAALRSIHALALAASLAAGLLVLLVEPEALADLWRRGTTRLPWFPPEAWDVRFYHRYLTDSYNYLWFLTPTATIAVLVTAFTPGLYLALLLWIPFVLLSAVVPTQTARYLFAFLPFLLLILAEAGRQAGGLLWSRLAVRLGEGLPWPRLARPLAGFLFVATAAVVVRGSPWFAAAQADRLKPTTTLPGIDQDQWREAAAYAAASAPDAAVIANIDHLALYYFGRVDGRLLYRDQRPHPGDRSVERTEHGWRFRSYRTGAPSFSGVEDLAAAIARHPRGWLVVERRRLEQHPGAFAPGVRTFILKRLEAKETPADASLALFFWDHAADHRRGAMPRVVSDR